MWPLKSCLGLIALVFLVQAVLAADHPPEMDAKLKKATECWNKCGQKENAITLQKGLYECSEDDSYAGPWSPCMMKCIGLSKAKDQKKCFCNHCKLGEQYKYFCQEPGPSHIEKDECDALVCTGKMKYFGAYCATPDHLKSSYPRYDDEL